MVSFLSRLSLLLVLVLTGANAAHSSRFVLASAATALKIRGGDVPLDPETTLKVMAAVGGAQGLAFWCGPKKGLEQYGGKPELNDEMGQYTTEVFGCGVTGYAIIMYCLLFKKTSIATAVKFTYIPWFLQHLRSTLSAKDSAPPPAKGGKAAEQANVINPQVTAALVVIIALCIYTTGQEYGDTSMKIQSAVWILSGLQMILAPNAAAESWMLDTTRMHDGALGMVRNIGYGLLATWVLVGSMVALDKSALEALGYGGIVWASMHIINNLLGANKKVGVDEGKIWVWAFLNVGSAALALLK